MNTFRIDMPAVPKHAVPGGAIRVNFPLSDTSYSLRNIDRGVALLTAGTTATLPPYNPRQQAEEYVVKNLSTDVVQVCPSKAADGTQEVFHTAAGPVICIYIPSDESRSFIRETTSQLSRWVVF